MEREWHIKNPQELRRKKDAASKLMQLESRKYGQIRALEEMVYLITDMLKREIAKEERELALIKEDRRTLKAEINALT